MVQGPNDLEALKNLLPTPPANTVNNEAQNRRNRRNGTETPLIQWADTVQLSTRAVQASEQAAVQRNAVAGPLNTAPQPGIAPNAPLPVPSRASNRLLTPPPVGAPATVAEGNAPAPRPAPATSARSVGSRATGSRSVSLRLSGRPPAPATCASGAA